MKFAKPFAGVKAGDVYPTQFAAGDTCPAELIGPARATGVLEQAGKAPTAKRDKA